ncbi:hypothetical protein Sgly_2989 [Syntrophobotulus glycolicus DSM 8271]|uniref:DUF2922 domain-containing protein n=1 Tax=Syntrophobotulus glycolicus (strain DSM 8271 / FlGlyR) TaxID=645991 RepID=F0SZT7_SYNGF|nr:DUF2922 domain-containing protein [Syntrophobotulus glycolicus]ADY57258.1 hypothetical protein Sgly_2989 [Syntrophobotulus glycolicus DSM 8271]
MSISSTRILRLAFTNAGGTTFSLTLPQPRADLTAEEIEVVMNQIIAKNMFSTKGGDLVEINDIKIIDTTTDDLFD